MEGSGFAGGDLLSIIRHTCAHDPDLAEAGGISQYRGALSLCLTHERKK